MPFLAVLTPRFQLYELGFVVISGRPVDQRRPVSASEKSSAGVSSRIATGE
jgi:hypothetical protein